MTRLAAGDLGHVFPDFLPDGRHFVYFVRAPQPRKGVYVGSIDSIEDKRVRATREKAIYAPPGYLLFLEQGRMFAQPFDVNRFELTGEPIPVAESVAHVNTDGRVSVAVSATGTLAYRVSGIRTASQPVWVDRQGRTISSVGHAGDYSSVSLSPDGSRLAIELHDLSSSASGLGGSHRTDDGSRTYPTRRVATRSMSAAFRGAVGKSPSRLTVVGARAGTRTAASCSSSTRRSTSMQCRSRRATRSRRVRRDGCSPPHGLGRISSSPMASAS